MPGVAPQQLLKNADFTTSRLTERTSSLVLPYINVDRTFWAVSRVGGTLLAVLRVGRTFWRYRELALFFWRKR